MANALNGRVSTRGMGYILHCAVAALVLCSLPAACGAFILVTNDYPTIQAAINAANPNDTIQVQSGIYRECLNILKPVRIIGSGSANCVLHHTNDVLITITSAGVVEFAEMEITGGDTSLGGGFYPPVPQAIIATNTTLVLNNVSIDGILNFMVTIVDGSLYATNVALDTLSAPSSMQCDVGFELTGCFARIYQLTQLAGEIDHTFDINDYGNTFSDVQLDSSTIQASRKSWGECLRTGSHSVIVITNCNFYRAPGGEPPDIGNQAIGVNGYSNAVLITGNLIDNVPTGIRVFGSLPNSNAIKIEHNVISNCESNGVKVLSMSYAGVDLGDGPFQSEGQNVFWNPGARDVELYAMSADIPAASNCWTSVNPDDSIWDKLDSPVLGRVLYDPTFCGTIALCVLNPTMATNTMGFAQTFTATVTTNGAPATGVAVSFSVWGTQTINPTNVVTDGDGQASFTYTGTSLGTDTVLAVGSIGVNRFGSQASTKWAGIAPQITCSADIVTNTATCAPVVTFNATATGVPTPSVSFNPPSGMSYYPGVTVVTATAHNSVGTAQCTFTVTVHDNHPPTIACVSDITTNIPFGQSQVNVAFGAPTVSDNCGVATNYSTPASGSSFALGTNTVTSTVVDVSGNTNSCSFHIMVLGLPNQPPVAQSSNLTVNADANCQATVAALAIDAGSFDNDGTILSRSLTPAGPFAKGTNPVTLTVFDNAGASNSCSAQIIVVDATPPTIACVGDITTNIPFGQSQVNVAFGAPTVSDNCGVATNYCTPASGSSFALGTNTVTCTAVDTSANTNTCTFSVSVLPTAPSPDDLTVLSIIPPKKINLSRAKPSQIKPVKVMIQNVGHQTITIDSVSELTNLMALTIESLGSCPVPVGQMIPPNKGFPVALAPKKKITVIYIVTFNCSNDNASGAGHEDFRYAVTLNHFALDGKADINPANDNCPRGPSGSDKGCGGRDPVTKQLGADVLTDVVEQP